MLDFVIGIGDTKCLINLPAFRLETWSLITKYIGQENPFATKNGSKFVKWLLAITYFLAFSIFSKPFAFRTRYFVLSIFSTIYFALYHLQ